MNARDYITLVRGSKFLIAGCVVACLALAGVMTALTPKSYASSATFYVVAGTVVEGQPNPTTDLILGAQLAKERVTSYTELVVGPRVAEDAAAALGGGTTAADVQARLAASSVAETVIFTVTATDGSPDAAVAVLTAVTDSFTGLVEQLETRPGSPAPLLTAEPVQQPSTPLGPVTPVLGLNLAIGGLLGLIIGFGVAIVRRSMDVSIRSAEELEAATEAAVLGVVPENTGRGSSSTPLVVGSGARAEAFRRVRTNLEFSNVDGNSRVLVVTSALTGEGKTTATCNLAAALAAVGNRVVLVDADLRRPAAAALLGLESVVGLTTVLTGRVDLDRALQTRTTVGFDVLASGRRPPRPNELLSSRRAGALIDELRSRYDFVLIDSPPILPVADAANLGTYADGAIVVCRWGRTSRQDVAAAVAFLHSVSVTVVGTVLSRAPEVALVTWGYSGTYAGAEPEQEQGQIAAAHGDLVGTNGSTTQTPTDELAQSVPLGPPTEIVSVPAVRTEVLPVQAQKGQGPLSGHSALANGMPRPTPTPRPRPRPTDGTP